MRRLAAALGLSFLCCGGSPDGAGRDLVVDALERLRVDEEARLEREIALLRRETGVEVGLHLAAVAPAGELESASAARLDRLPSPRTRPGALWLYDARSRRARLEVGYALEPVIPDALAGDWVDEHVSPLLSGAAGVSPDEGAVWLLAIRMLQDRVRHAALDGSYDPAAGAPPGRFRAGGGGASGPPMRASSEAVELHAVASATRPCEGDALEDVYDAYLSWLADADPSVVPDCFTPQTRRFLRDWPLSPGFMEHVLDRELGKAYDLLSREPHALLVFRDDPLLAPHFFRATDRGWQMDLWTEAHEIVNLIGGPLSWSLRWRPGPAVQAFADQVVRLDGALRLRSGDNRRLPTATSSPTPRMRVHTVW